MNNWQPVSRPFRALFWNESSSGSERRKVKPNTSSPPLHSCSKDSCKDLRSASWIKFSMTILPEPCGNDLGLQKYDFITFHFTFLHFSLQLRNTWVRFFRVRCSQGPVRSKGSCSVGFIIFGSDWIGLMMQQSRWAGLTRMWTDGVIHHGCNLFILLSERRCTPTRDPRAWAGEATRRQQYEGQGSISESKHGNHGLQGEFRCLNIWRAQLLQPFPHRDGWPARPQILKADNSFTS